MATLSRTDAEALADRLLEQVQYYLETASLLAVTVDESSALAVLGFEGVLHPQHLPEADDQLESVAFDVAHALLDARRSLPPPSQ